MADPVRAGNDVSGGTFTCTGCGYPLDVGSRQHLPLCPFCHSEYWQRHHPSELVRDRYHTSPIAGDHHPEA